jgi:hypothetical protein
MGVYRLMIVVESNFLALVETLGDLPQVLEHGQAPYSREDPH